jgi:segregation and condensation protein A
MWSQVKATAAIEIVSHSDNPNHDRVGIFWALLLLSAQSKVELVQEEFYQDLKIRRLLESGSAE